MSEIGRLIVRGLKEAVRQAKAANRPTQAEVDNVVRGVFPPRDDEYERLRKKYEGK